MFRNQFFVAWDQFCNRVIDLVFLLICFKTISGAGVVMSICY